MQQYLIGTFLFFLTACTSNAEQAPEDIPAIEQEELMHPSGKTVAERFSAPRGFKRVEVQENSFAAYLQHFKLKPHGSKVYYFNATVKPNDNIYDAVLDIDVGKKDLQQCADAIIRLRAEYLFKQKRYDDIHFDFTNGFRADYNKWQQGNRVQVKGSNCSWVKKATPTTSYISFKEYLQVVFTYAGTLSLEKELRSASVKDIQIGDVFIKGGSPGHAVIIMDVAVNNATGEKLFLLAQSYMPAQEIHILQNPMDPTISPWYSNSFKGSLYTPEWTFQRSQLKKFTISTLD